jgi:hypothetical protein
MKKLIARMEVMRARKLRVIQRRQVTRVIQVISSEFKAVLIFCKN